MTSARRRVALATARTILRHRCFRRSRTWCTAGLNWRGAASHRAISRASSAKGERARALDGASPRLEERRARGELRRGRAALGLRRGPERAADLRDRRRAGARAGGAALFAHDRRGRGRLLRLGAGGRRAHLPRDGASRGRPGREPGARSDRVLDPEQERDRQHRADARGRFAGRARDGRRFDRSRAAVDSERAAHGRLSVCRRGAKRGAADGGARAVRDPDARRRARGARDDRVGAGARLRRPPHGRRRKRSSTSESRTPGRSSRPTRFGCCSTCCSFPSGSSSRSRNT